MKQSLMRLSIHNAYINHSILRFRDALNLFQACNVCITKVMIKSAVFLIINFGNTDDKIVYPKKKEMPIVMIGIQ